MALISDTFDRKKKLLEESYVLIERLKKLRALNADPRLLGIDPHLPGIGIRWREGFIKKRRSL